MLFSAKAINTQVQTADTGKIRLGGACRLPLSGDRKGATIRPLMPPRPLASTQDTGKIRLGGACRLPLANR